MARYLTVELLEERAYGHVRDQFSLLVSLIKGVTLANAAVVLATFWAIGRFRWESLPFWITSLLAMIVTYESFMVGTIVLLRLTNSFDIFMPFILGIVEFLLFSFLNVGISADRWLWTYFAFTVIAVVFISLILSSVRAVDYSAELQGLAEDYRRSLYNDRKGAALSMIISLLAALVAWRSLVASEHAWILGIVLALPLTIALRDQQRTRKMISSYLTQVPADRA